MKKKDKDENKVVNTDEATPAEPAIHPENSVLDVDVHSKFEDAEKDKAPEGAEEETSKNKEVKKPVGYNKFMIN